MKEVRFSQSLSRQTTEKNGNLSKRKLFSLQRPEIRKTHEGHFQAWSSFNEAKSMLHDIAQSRVIDSCFGEMSSGSNRDRNWNNKGKKFSKLRESRLNEIPLLPPLTNPGSNMNNTRRGNALNVLGRMTLEPLENAEELISLNPIVSLNDENYNKARVFFMLSSCVCIFLIFFEFSSIIVGIIYTNSCQMVDVFLVVSGCFHLVIILLEWAKAWIWNSNDNPAGPDSSSDHMQLFVSCVLIGLYSISIVWYTVGFAWIPTVFVNFLQQNTSFSEDIVIVKDGQEYIHRVPKCSHKVYLFAIGYQVVVGILFLLRMVLCCMSDFCRGLCNKFASHSADAGFQIHSDNPINEILPPIRNPIYKFGLRSNRNVTGLSALMNTSGLSMIAPIPMYPSERLNMVEESQDFLSMSRPRGSLTGF